MDRQRVFAGTVPPPNNRTVPGPRQESVWDYPRPPRVEPVPERIRVVVDGTTLADTTRAYRVLETAGAPVYYVPPADVRSDLLAPTEHRSVCEWKGDASYWSIVLPDRTIPNAAWSYPDPMPGYEVIRDHLAFYAWSVDQAWVGDELATGSSSPGAGTAADILAARPAGGPMPSRCFTAPRVADT